MPSLLTRLVPAVLLSLLMVAPSLAAERVVLYSGRAKSLVQPLLEKFTKTTGVEVDLIDQDTAPLAMRLIEEGRRTPADVFWAQDAGALGALVDADRLAKLPEDVLAQVGERFRSPDGRWVATSGRARTLAYSTQRVKGADLPGSVFDLTDAKYRGRVGWAPSNASFQSFVTAMIQQHGIEKTEAWLRAMKENGTKVYPKNSAIIEAIAAGDVDFGLPNHYYLLRYLAKDDDYPVAQAQFEKGDVGNLVNVAGVGIVEGARNRDAALKLVNFLLSEEAQTYFANETYEYPVIEDVKPREGLWPLETLGDNAPEVSLEGLHNLNRTLELLRKVGLL